MKGFVFVSEKGYNRQKDFQYWINPVLDYNTIAKTAKKKRK
jgi:hypothetical protein